MPTTTTLPQFTAGAGSTSTATGSKAAPAAGVSTGSTATTPTTAPNPLVATSGALTSDLAQAQFKVTATPAAAPAASPKKGKKLGKLPNGKQANRLHVLEYIATTAKPPTYTAPAKSTDRDQIGIPDHPNTVTMQGTEFTPEAKAVINQIGKHLFGATFTLGTHLWYPETWKKIQAAAATRAHERQTNDGVSKAADQATPSTTGTVTGQKLYTVFIKTYNSGDKGATPSTKNKTNAQVWNDRFVAMGIIDHPTATPAEAQEAYKQVLKQAQAGNTSATKVIQTQISEHAATLKAAQLTQGTAKTEANYFYQQFQTIAHSYMIPMSTTTLNQRAAIAAQAAGSGATTYYARTNELDNFRQTIQKQAASLYGTFATQINKGVTTRTLLNPYAEVAAKTLGYGTASAATTAESALGITWMNPKWNVALSGGKSATGKYAAPMSLTEFRQHLITTPQFGWSKTSTAQQVKLNVGQSLADSFGLRKQ